MGSRTVVTDEQWTLLADPIRDGELRSDAADLQDRLDAALRPTSSRGSADSDIETALARLDEDAATLTRGLRSDAVGPDPGPDRDEAIDLLLACSALRPRLQAERDDRGDRAFAAVREAVGVLSGVTTVGQLIERAPMAAARLGFDRAFVSSIDDACFVPQACYIRGDPDWAAAILEAGRREPRRLDRHLLETEMLRRRQPIRVQDAQRGPNVHPEIAEVSMSRSYVAAPIVVRDEVIGFIHADYYEQRRIVSEQDATSLWMFADAFGLIHERVLLGEQIGDLRSALQRALGAAEHRFASITGREPSLRPADPSDDGTRAPAPPRPRQGLRSDGWTRHPGPDELLTRRELEVLGLMADGSTNDGIATRLVISHGTVKTHVKHILRKLGAANRAEAVSRYFQRERERDAERNGAGESTSNGTPR